jgi:hypothetical protein
MFDILFLAMIFAVGFVVGYGVRHAKSRRRARIASWGRLR